MTQEETIKKIIEMADSIGEECIHEGGDDYDKYVSYNNHPEIEHLAGEFESILCDFIITENGGTKIGNMMEFNKFPNNKYRIGPGEQDSFGWLSGVLVRKEDNALIYCFG